MRLVRPREGDHRCYGGVFLFSEPIKLRSMAVIRFNTAINASRQFICTIVSFLLV